MPEPSTPSVSIIVPSWTGSIDRLRASIEAQTFRDYEIEVVVGVSPAARARNVGAARSRGDILLFVDDDAYFGHPRVVEMLVNCLRADPGIAVVGTSKLAPPTASRLQRAIARQVPRMVYPIVRQNRESNPPLDRYGFTAITTTCCAVRRSVYEAVSGFDEGLTTGPEDTDFFYRVRRLGHRLIVAAECWVYHDPPADLRDMLRKSFWYGLGHALEARKNPERRMALLPLDHWYGKVLLLGALPAFLPALFVHYYFDPVRRVRIGFRPLKKLSTYAVLAGYVYGWFHGAPTRPATTYRGQAAAQSAGPPEIPPATRVLYIDAYPKIGGGQQVLLSVVTRLAPDEYRPLVGLPAGSPLHGRLAAAGVPTVALPFDRANLTLPDWQHPLSLVRAMASVARAVLAIDRLVGRERIDLIHANSVVAGVHALPVAMRRGIPCVVHAHDFLTAALTDRSLRRMLGYRRAAMIFVSRALATYYGATPGGYTYRVIHNGVDLQEFRADPHARARTRAVWAV
ncbi:MAG TPA: glycosyltransferase, partial [Chloroflexia bacterium]|nr:glycosyltransferase [Chloroflexia bacterium]